jgi:choline dehydrogenase-like flavoprotein
MGLVHGHVTEVEKHARRYLCMGNDSADGRIRIDHAGKVFGYDGLYVADGSMIPSALVVNPSLTISALGERVAFWMLHDRDLRPGDPEAPKNR